MPLPRPGVLFAAIFAATLALRLCHAGVLWVEEAYPTAAALEMLRGRVLYGDIWFDKPPLFPLLYLLWGAAEGWVLRLAGAVFVTLSAASAWWAARRMAGDREAALAAILLAFFLNFGVPSAVMALTPDLLLVPLHFAAIGCAAAGLPFAAGLLCGLGMLVNTKAALVLAACALWQWRQGHRLLSGFLGVQILAAAALAAAGALGAYWEQVWTWGAVYSRATFVDNPWAEGLRRTLNWTGMHAALALGAAIWFWKHRTHESARLAAWLLLSLAGVALGARFFPRYYFHLLPAMTIIAARGLALAPPRALLAAALLLAVPLARYGPRYADLALDALGVRATTWRDLALERDSRAAAALLAPLQQPGDNVLVWGYRPELYAFTRLPAATRYLDSQPLSGVLADRHLTDATVTYPELAIRHRAQLGRAPRPRLIIDGLGPLNPRLSFFELSGFSAWAGGYEIIGRTPHSIIYRLREQ
jgi:4-amino-4-deoxy-L-arabinose transferase-like glycosyltransferase